MNQNDNLKLHLKILIIGDADSIWIKTIIEQTHIPYGDQVSVLTFKNSTFTEFYEQNKISVYYLKSIKSLMGPLNLLHNIQTVIQRYDVIIVHFVQPHRALLANIGSIFSKKLILVFWGSDILRAKKSYIVKKALKKAYSIVIGTKELTDHFHQMYGSSYDGKIYKVNFGANGVETLNKKKYDLTLISEKYGIDNNKVILSIGYSNSFSQQHLKVLETVGNLPKEIRDKIHIMLRLSYGDGSTEYIESIKQRVDKLGCSYTVFESYLDKDEIAETTSLADIFVHALISDARSASMCEHMFAGSLVIVPSWINYDIEDKVFYLKYNSFEELGIILSKNIVKKGMSTYKEQLEKNRRGVYEICSWDVHARNWRNLYLM